MNPTRADPLHALLDTAVDRSLGFLREVDPDAAAEVGAWRDQQPERPAVVVVGETKRGKSSLVNALVQVPGLVPVDPRTATTAYLELVPDQRPHARAYPPGWPAPVELGLTDLPGWASTAGPLPDGVPPPRRIEVHHPAPLLRELVLVDTPGAGGLDPLHAEVTLAVVERATVLLFVADAAAPLAAPELEFLIEASRRVELVVFALTKIDGYPGWRTILADNRARLVARAARFGAAGWFPVSARLAELAGTVPGPAAAELTRESRVDELRQALRELAGQARAVRQANLLRAIRSELERRELAAADQIRATDPDPDEQVRIRRHRAEIAARKRAESRHWPLALRTEIERARVATTTSLRTALGGLQEQLLGRIDRAGPAALAALPRELDHGLYAVSVRLSQELAQRFGQVGERALAQLFPASELRHVLGGVNASLRHTLTGAPHRDRGGPDQVMIAMSAGGLGFMAGRGAMAGVAALGAGTVAGSGLLIPVAGIGLGLAAGAFVLYRRRVATDRQQARGWVREALAEARAALAEEVAHRFAELQYALTVALEEAIDRRLRQLDGQLAEIDRTQAADQTRRAQRRAALQADREALRTRIRQLDEVLTRAAPPAPSGMLT